MKKKKITLKVKFREILHEFAYFSDFFLNFQKIMRNFSQRKSKERIHKFQEKYLKRITIILEKSKKK